MKRRTPYRPDQGFALSRIERRRQQLGITHVELYTVAEIPRNTYARIRKTGLAFKRHVIALRFAIRTIEQRRRLVGKMLGVADV
ncbi:hypothetical protein [Sinorhizobium fredii]|uniref:hypothetical protein n=1 Tax=Rhizobium fredii TaxID=380 RepID=UPI0035167B09